MRERSTSHGFSIVELMIAVAVMGVLAKLVIPMFSTDSNKSKARAEVGAMFAELQTKEQQYKLDHADFVEAAACPATPTTQPQDATGCVASGQPWADLRVLLPETKLMCSYQIYAGDADSTPTPPSPFDSYTTTSNRAWFYIIATCDTDGDSTVNSTYYTSSWDTRIRAANEGH